MLERALNAAEESQAEALCEEIIAAWADRINEYADNNADFNLSKHLQGLLEDLAYEAACIAVIST